MGLQSFRRGRAVIHENGVEADSTDKELIIEGDTFVSIWTLRVFCVKPCDHFCVARALSNLTTFDLHIYKEGWEEEGSENGYNRKAAQLRASAISLKTLKVTIDDQDWGLGDDEGDEYKETAPVHYKG